MVSGLFRLYSAEYSVPDQSRCDLSQLRAVLCQDENPALGDEANLLAGMGGDAAQWVSFVWMRESRDFPDNYSGHRPSVPVLSTVKFCGQKPLPQNRRSFLRDSGSGLFVLLPLISVCVLTSCDTARSTHRLPWQCISEDPGRCRNIHRCRGRRTWQYHRAWRFLHRCSPLSATL